MTVKMILLVIALVLFTIALYLFFIKNDNERAVLFLLIEIGLLELGKYIKQ